jgi:hypothetical protein
VITGKKEMVTPTALLTALYAEYDGLLDSFESVQLQLKAKGSSNETTRRELQLAAHSICEALADVHEKLDDFDFVIVPR